MRMFKLLLPVVLVVVCVSVLQSDTILVPSHQPTIQAGIDAAVDGDTVLVDDGMYTGDGNRDLDFLSKAIIVMSVNGRDNCVIECEGDSLDPHRGFFFHNGEDSHSVVQGFTIQNGYVVGDDLEGRGGGILCDGSSPTIRGNAISNNYAIMDGGGIRCGNGSQPIVSGNLITGNRSDNYGGGIQCASSAPMIRNNTITGNTAYLHGGGINCWLSTSPVISGNTITGNTSVIGGGGGLGTARSTPHIEGNIFSENTVFMKGGAILCRIGTVSIVGNVITGNTANDAAGAVTCQDSSSVVVIHSIMWGDSSSTGSEIYVDSLSSLTVTFSDVEGGWPGEGNISLHPLFRNPPAGDYHLMAIDCGDPYDSPCIDAGHPDSLDVFLDCSGGLGTYRCDIGAYGGRGSTPVSVPVSEKNEIEPIPRTFDMLQNYPNPFNPVTTISFEIPEASGGSTAVQLTVYDLRGSQVIGLINANLEPGRYEVVWEGRDNFGRLVASGIYFYTLRSGSTVCTKKMLMLE